MWIKAIALSLAFLIGGAVIVPLATDSTEAGPHHKRHRKHAKRYKKYSKGWWRQYRARQRKLRRIRAAKRALRLRRLRLEKAAQGQNLTAAAPAQNKAKSAVLPSGQAAPQSWSPATVSPSELQFRIDNQSGDQVGSASISVVGPAVSNSGDYARSRAIGGVSTTSLRRDVIDKMIRENGWVVNDYQKEISGQSVYVVVAQSQARNGSVQSRMFYFTEVEGKIYSVSTNSPAQEQERLAEESEKVINSLKSRLRPGLRAAVKE